MSNITVTQNQKKALAIATGVACLSGTYLLRSFFTLFVIAAVLAYLFTPTYNMLKKRMSNNSAATLTLLINIIIIVVPLTLIAFFATNQVRNLIDTIAQQTAHLDVSQLGHNAIDTANTFLHKIPFVTYSINTDTLVEGARSLVSKFGTSLLNYFSSLLGSIFSMFTTAIIYIFLFLSLLKNGPKLLDMFRALNPLGRDISNLYLSQTAAMVKGTVSGQFAIAVLQGLIGAATLALAGLPNVFFVMFLVLTVLSIIPLGGGILVIPIGIIMMLTGNIVGGILVIAGHILVTTNIDNILRPKLVPKEARLDAALMLLAVFSGIATFGFLGIIIGPTIMVLIVTTVKVYLSTQQKTNHTTHTKTPNK